MSSHFFILTTQLNGNLGGIRFGQDENGNYGYYKVGADTVTPFSDISIPFKSTYLLGTANFLTSYDYIYSEIKVPVGGSSKSFSMTCLSNSNDNLSILSITGSDGKEESIHPNRESQQISLDISASEYVTVKFDKPLKSNTITYWCQGEYTIE